MSEARSLPLQGVKVIELGTLIAGPFCARVLAEFGAEVIKIESPDGGDPLRKWRKLHQGTSLWWYAQARNKKSVTLNLKHPEAQEIVRRLAADADIVIENFRPGALEKWGLGWDVLSKLNPRLIMVRLSGFGQTGPYRDRPGFGAIGESMGGMRYVTGYPDRPPVRVGVSIGDSIAALHGVIGALMAMHHRNVNGGRGQVIDVALYEAVFNMMESVLPEYDMYGFVRERSGASLPGIVPSNTYVTRDRKFVVIGANADSIFKRMMNAIGRADLANDPALAHNDGRVARTEEIERVISDWVAANDLERVLAVLEKADVPSGKIYDIADIAQDPHYAAREMILDHRLKGGESLKLPGIVPRLSETPGATKWVGPALGEHTAEVLAALGYSGEQQRGLKERGVT
ncbi:MAG: formyl-CoA transferase [Betaproteobacteria bacterium RIFCSPLOWO2_02_FULL_67_26]|nr:MAG: formyl-CoA transferase [Betaproteobacteria bacterium RIFCSPLOWO2_02_FULL_67_26]